MPNGRTSAPRHRAPPTTEAVNMASLLFNLRRTLPKELEELQPTPGYCILVDIVDSTALKDSGLDVWPMRIFNTFSLVRNYLKECLPLKSLGDSLMFFVRESDLNERGQTALDLFLPLTYVAQEESREIFGRSKIAAAYCQDAYEITFLKGTDDIYGKDINLTARLMALALEGELVMNEGFVDRVRKAYDASPFQKEFPDVPKIVGPWPQRFKGFATYINIYKLSAGGTSLEQHMAPLGAAGNVAMGLTTFDTKSDGDPG